MSENTEKEEIKYQIVDRKFFVSRDDIGEQGVLSIVNSVKDRIFGKKFAFFSSKDVRIIPKEIDRKYKLLIKISGTYTVDYFRKAYYIVLVDRNVQEVVINDRPIKVETSSEEKDMYQVKIEALERVVKSNSDYMIIDAHGRELGKNAIPNVKYMEITDAVIRQYDDYEKPATHIPEHIRKLISRLKGILPRKYEKINNENIMIAEYFYYIPVYYVTLLKAPEGSTKKLEINGITGEVREIK